MNQSPFADCCEGAVLAGGFGIRLRPTVGDLPKVLAPVAGRPFITYILDDFAALGLSRVVICTGYQADVVHSALGRRYRGLELVYSREETPLGTGGALARAAATARVPLILAANGDSHCRCDLPSLFACHQSAGGLASMVLAHVADTRRFGRVTTNPDGRIISFQEKAAAVGPGWINAGLYLLSRPALQELSADQPCSIERDVFPTWISRGLFGFGLGRHFLDIGTPESYASASAWARTAA
jgi:NDP-sugar pyrophosphorylase family protein